MSVKISWFILGILLTMGLMSLFYTNATAHNFIVKEVHRLGINLGNYITNTPVCPPTWTCFSPN